MLLIPMTLLGQELPDDRLRNRLQHVKYSSGKIDFDLFGSCSGNFIASTDDQPNTLFFLTAAHCVPTNTDFATLTLGNDRLLDALPSIKGVTDFVPISPQLVALNRELDFALFLIDKPNNIESVIYELGWNKEIDDPSFAYLFHFPNGNEQVYDIKRNDITIDTYPGDILTNNPLPDGFWKVRKGFSDFETATGSSGAILINPKSEVLGPLTGVSLTNLDTINYFSRFDLAYDLFPAPDLQLASWIDFDQLGQSIGGFKDLVKHDNYMHHDELAQFIQLGKEGALSFSSKTPETLLTQGIFLPLHNITNNTQGELIVRSINTNDDRELARIDLATLMPFSENLIRFDQQIELASSGRIVIVVDNGAEELMIEFVQLKAFEKMRLNKSPFLAASFLTNDPTQKEYVDEPFELTAFPNPSNSFFYLSPIDNLVEYAVFDNLGQQLEIPFEAVNGEGIFDFRNAQKGTYLLRLVLENGRVISKKIILQ
jgi:hypothetical protein